MAPQAVVSKEPMRERAPRVDFRRVAQEDVRLRRVRLREMWRSAPGVGGREGGFRGAGDSGAPGLAHGRCEVGPGTKATPGRVVLRLKTAHRPLPRT